MRKLLPIFIAILCGLATASARADAPQELGTVVARLDADGIQRAAIVGGDYFFKPRHLVVKVNLPVELTLSRETGIVPHTLVIKAPEAGIVLDRVLSTEIGKVTFTPTATGAYPYYCRNKLLFFKSHREQGMEGVLEVVP
ncbi:cupredoxin domain-containing protein [Herminiimonas sp. CN]|uniref:cupredoxin domain-containing protein n=1 Tax=Herminiimonas sp. CN TaxID=1349818 RepID=UPI00047440DC|nr:cupredoxin domain-containing protein [Herminiimonas sp. CN]